jgi:hypothetical protein
MKRFDYFIQKYLVWGFPNVVATMSWNYFQTDLEIRSIGSLLITVLWEIMSWGLIIWFVSLFTFMVLLIMRKDTQESTIKRIAGINERDEREEIITGHAARRSFISTTSFLIFLFFISSVQVNLAKNTTDNSRIDGKSSLSLGFRFEPTEPAKTISNDGSIIYEHRDIPLSKSGIILLVLLWQVTIFRYRVRKDLKYV